jgi:hypothetical protein
MADDDVIADYRSMAEESKTRRQSNRANSAKILRDKCISFQSRNMGAHLIVEYGGETVDFWPGTGKWIRRRYPAWPQNGRGIFEMLKALGVD